MSYSDKKKKVDTIPMPSVSSGGGIFSDRRPATNLQLKQQMMMGSFHGRTLAQAKNITAKNSSGIFSCAPIQRVLSTSATYPLTSPWANGEATAIDNQVAAAEQAAVIAVNGVTAGTAAPTPYQLNYVRNPSHRAWGYCVEEQLNQWAIGQGWATQSKVGSCRPDYRKINGNMTLYVDLTSPLQAGANGQHITDKLNNCGMHLYGHVYAADILHASQNPLGNAPGQIPNTTVTPQEAEFYQFYRKYCQNQDEEFDEALEKVKDEYGNVGMYKFLYTWGAKERSDMVDFYIEATELRSDEGESDYEIEIETDEENS